jgi:hypothetical protein
MTLSAAAQSTDDSERPTLEAHRSVAVFAMTRQAVAVRATIGIGSALGALALPWLGLTLTPSLSVWQLTFSLGAVPLLHHVSYGLVIAVLALCASVSFARSRGATTLVTRGIGWTFIGLSIVFVCTTRMVGTGTMFKLQNDANQMQIINSQFLTNSNIPPPAQFLGVTFDGKTLVLLYALRLGWYLLLVAGILLAGRLRRPSTRLQFAAVYAAGLAVVTIIFGLGLGASAQSNLDNGIQAVTIGRAVSGEQLIATALRLNPQLAYDPGLQQALGKAEANQGRQTGLAAYAEAVRPVGKDLTLPEKARLFSNALAALPPSSPQGAVVRADVAIFLANATIASKNPDLLTLVTSELGSPAVTFSIGRYYFEAGANSLAVRMLTHTYAETSNSEVRSLALTYIALAWQREGDEQEFRSNIVAAVHADRLNQNVYAREVAAGLYLPGSP